MTAQNILNVIGLLTGMIGAYIMFYFSRKVNSSIWIYSRAEAAKIKKKDKYRNEMVRHGLLLLFAQFLSDIFSQNTNKN